MKTEIQQKLEKLAQSLTIPFCYSDYLECPSGVCPKCGSDDLMVLHPGHSLEWGYETAIREIVESKFTPVNTDELFEESMRDCYPETTQIGFIEYDTVSAMKELDPVAWDIARSEYIDSLVEDDVLICLFARNEYYFLDDLNNNKFSF